MSPEENGFRRPRIIPRWTAADYLIRIIGLTGLIALVALTATTLQSAPEKVPLHFDFAGTPDRWGSPLELLGLPLVGLVLWIMLTVLTRYPHAYNYPTIITPENAERHYAIARRLLLVMRALIAWSFAFLLYSAGRVARADISELSPWFLPALLIAIGVSLVWYFVAAAGADR